MVINHRYRFQPIIELINEKNHDPAERPQKTQLQEKKDGKAMSKALGASQMRIGQEEACNSSTDVVFPVFR